MKKILLTNHHLENYAGSELVTFELAQEFKNRGWDVTVATFLYRGNMKKIFEQNNIKVCDILNNSLLEKDFDLVWSHHFPLLYKCFFLEKIKAKNLILSSLSPYEPLEDIVYLYEESNLILCNSQETKNYHLQNFPIYKDKFYLFPNSVAKEYFKKSKNQDNYELKKIGVISNHIAPEIREVITKIQTNNIDVVFAGLQNRPQFVDSKFLKDCDLVITIGRTVQHCMALKIPVFVYDHFGGPGWLDESNYENAEFFNYSGRCCHRKINADQIIAEIFDGYEKALQKLDFFYNYAQENYNLSKNIDYFLGKIDLEKNDFIQIKTTNQNDCQKYHDVFYKIYTRELNEKYHYYVPQLQETQSQLQKTQSQLEETQSQLEETQSQLQQVKEMILSMESSKFWKLRNLWFKIKRLFIL